MKSESLRIIIDADATPSIKLIEDIAKNNNIKCVLIADDSHEFNTDYSEVIIVSQGVNSADIYIANYIRENDIVITQDYGVASIALGKKCICINTKGYFYDNNTIDSLMMIKHINNKTKNKIKGPKKRTKEDDKRLLKSILKAINQ